MASSMHWLEASARHAGPTIPESGRLASSNRARPGVGKLPVAAVAHKTWIFAQTWLCPDAAVRPFVWRAGHLAGPALFLFFQLGAECRILVSPLKTRPRHTHVALARRRANGTLEGHTHKLWCSHKNKDCHYILWNSHNYWGTLSLSCTLPRCCRVLVALLKVWAALICCDRSVVLVVSKLRCLRLRGGGGVHVLSGESDVLHEGAKSC